MVMKRIAPVLIAGFIVLVLIGTLAFVSALSSDAGLLAVATFRALFPSTIEWGDKDGFKKCPGAIANSRKWPIEPIYACLAMHLCANEMKLSESQRRALYDQIHKTPGCQEP